MKEYLLSASQSDCDLIFKWSNEEDVRKNSFNSEKILYENHVEWFNKKINSSDYMMFLFYFDEQPSGLIRLEIKDKTSVLSYSVTKEYRGRGLATKMILLLEDKIRNGYINIDNLIALVKYDNKPSQRIFEKLGYIVNKRNDFIEYKKSF